MMLVIGGSCVYVPQRNTPEEAKPLICMAFVNGDHFVRVKLKIDCPIPPICDVYKLPDNKNIQWMDKHREGLLSLLQVNKEVAARASPDLGDGHSDKQGAEMTMEERELGAKKDVSDGNDGDKQRAEMRKEERELGAKKDVSDGNDGDEQGAEMRKEERELGAKKDVSDGNDGDKQRAEMRMEGGTEERELGANNEMKQPQDPKKPQRKRKAERPPIRPLSTRPLSTRTKRKPMKYVESLVDVDCGKPRKKRKAKKKKVEEQKVQQKRNVNTESRSSNVMPRGHIFKDDMPLTEGNERDETFNNNDGTTNMHSSSSSDEEVDQFTGYQEHPEKAVEEKAVEHHEKAVEEKQKSDNSKSIQTTEEERRDIDSTVVGPLIQTLRDFLRIEDENEGPSVATPSEELLRSEVENTKSKKDY